MLNCHRIRQLASTHRLLAVVIAIFLLLALAAAVSLFVPLYGEVCGKNEYTGAKECASYHIVLAVFWHLIKWTNAYGAAITALATIAVAGFTGTLWWCAAGQYDLLEKQIALAREEFEATHRPQIICLYCESYTGAGEGDGVEINYVNAGPTPAEISEIGVIVVPTSNLRPGVDLKRHPVGKTLASGEKGKIAVGSHIITLARAERIPRARGVQIYCLGCISYNDRNGIRRETGFCRGYDADTDTWHRVENSDYEYGY